MAAVLPAAGREVETLLTRGQVEGWTARFADELHQQVSVLKHSGEPTGVLVSAHAARLPGLVARLGAVRGVELSLLPVQSAALGALRCASAVRSQPGALRFVTRLPRPEAPEAASLGAAVLAAARSEGRAGPQRPASDARALRPPPPTRSARSRWWWARRRRRERASLRLEGETAGVSRAHCRFFESAGESIVEDLSTWGTFVNGERVAGRAVLAAGDKRPRRQPRHRAGADRGGGGLGDGPTPARDQHLQPVADRLHLLRLRGADPVPHDRGLALGAACTSRTPSCCRREVDKREQEVLEGQAHLVEVRNSFREIEQKRAETSGLSTRILETLKQIEEELAIYDGKTVAHEGARRTS